MLNIDLDIYSYDDLIFIHDSEIDSSFVFKGNTLRVGDLLFKIVRGVSNGNYVMPIKTRQGGDTSD